MPRLPIRTELEVRLPADERARIETSELYRYEVRRRLETEVGTERRQFWLEKVAVPLVIALLTVTATGFAIPLALSAADRSRREAQLTAGLMQEIAQQTMEMQTNVDSLVSAVDAFWLDSAELNAQLGEFALKRDLGDMANDEFQRQDNLMENDRKRINEHHDTAIMEYAKHASAYRVWLSGMQTRLRVLYRTSAGLKVAEKALAKLDADRQSVDAIIDARDTGYAKLQRDQVGAVKSERQRFRNKTVTREVYREEVNTLLDGIRATKPLPGRDIRLDNGMIATLIEFVHGNKPAV
jgi:hypothetical protein